MSEQQPADGRRYLTIKELSEQSGFSVTQIRRWVAAGKIAYFQPGAKEASCGFLRIRLNAAALKSHSTTTLKKKSSYRVAVPSG